MEMPVTSSSEAINNTSANLTAPGQTWKLELLPAAIGGSVASAVVVLVIIVAVVCVLRHRSKQTSRHKHETLLGSPSTEEPSSYEIVQDKDSFESMSFPEKGNNSLPHLKLGDSGRLHLFASNTNISTNTNASLDKESVNTHPPVIVLISKGTNMKGDERSVQNIDNCLHINTKLGGYQARHGGGIRSKPERLTNTSIDSNEYVNYSRQCSAGTAFYLETGESQDELYANSQDSSDDSVTTAARQSGASLRDGDADDMWMRSESMQFLPSQTQSHHASDNLLECSDDIYVNNASLHKCTITNTQHELSDNQEIADELYINFSEVHTDNDNESNEEWNHNIDSEETSQDIDFSPARIQFHHNETNGNEGVQSPSTANKAKKRHDYKNAYIFQLSDHSVATDIPSTASFVISGLEEPLACQYSIVEYAPAILTGHEEVDTEQSVYNRLREDLSCVVNVYDSFR